MSLCRFSSTRIVRDYEWCYHSAGCDCDSCHSNDCDCGADPGIWDLPPDVMLCLHWRESRPDSARAVQWLYGKPPYLDFLDRNSSDFCLTTFSEWYRKSILIVNFSNFIVYLNVVELPLSWFIWLGFFGSFGVYRPIRVFFSLIWIRTNLLKMIFYNHSNIRLCFSFTFFNIGDSFLTGRDLYRAIPAMTQDPGFHGLTRRVAQFSNLLRLRWGTKYLFYSRSPKGVFFDYNVRILQNILFISWFEDQLWIVWFCAWYKWEVRTVW